MREARGSLPTGQSVQSGLNTDYKGDAFLGARMSFRRVLRDVGASVASEGLLGNRKQPMVWNAHENGLYIGGNWHAPSTDERLQIVSPYSEVVIASVATAAPADVDKAVTAARLAFDRGPWPRMTVEERISVVRRLRDIVERRVEEVAQVITDEMGSPITASRTQQARIPIAMLDSFIEIARGLPLTEERRSDSASALVIREPKGVVAAIVPWNAPMMSVTMKIGPALLAGCAVVIKTSPETALSGNMLAEMIDEAGFPDGLLSVLPANRETSEYLALHPGIDKVSFTGSTGAGRHLAARCGEMLRPITLELGGKSAALILDDADVPAAVASLRVGSLRNSGQVCSLKTRIVVSNRRKDEVLSALAALLESMPVGNPNDPSTEIGPMATRAQMERVAGYIVKGAADGARVVVGGPGRPEGLDTGWFVRPTLFDDVAPGATIAQEEIFGPVLAVVSYADEDEAIAIANHSPYGLNGAIFTADLARATRLARRIKTGVVEINGSGTGFQAPIGGVKASGIGREAGPEGFEPFFDLKSVGLPSNYAESLV